VEVVEEFSGKVAFLEKNDPLLKHFQNFVPKTMTFGISGLVTTWLIVV